MQALRRLVGRRSARLDDGLVVVEGAKVLAEALDAGRRVDALFLAPGAADPVIARARAAGAAVFELAPGVMEKVADTVTPQPVLAVVASPLVALDALRPALVAGGFVVVCAELSDPGNAGTVIRSAESSGAAGVVLCDGSVDATSPKTVRSSAGALFHVPVVQGGDLRQVLDTLGTWGVRRWATEARSPHTVDYDLADLTGPTALVMGNEAHGLPADLGPLLDGALTIPMTGHTESLNVGMATSVLCFEASRQRRRSGEPG